MSDPHEQGRICDFCEIAVEPDETLKPVFVGEPSEPKPHVLQAVEKKSRRNNMHILGHEASSFVALYKALQDCPEVQLDISNRVFEPEPEPFDASANLEKPWVRGEVEFDHQVNEDKVGVKVKIEPKNVIHQPAAEVCNACKEMFENL